MVAGGGRSKIGGDGGASGRARLVSSRCEEDMTDGSYIQINISGCCLADCPPFPSRLSARPFPSGLSARLYVTELFVICAAVRHGGALICSSHRREREN